MTNQSASTAEATQKPPKPNFDYLLFTDGSGHEDQLGGWCATVISFLGRKPIKKIVLGGANNLTVDRAEMTALAEGLHQIRELSRDLHLGRRPVVWWYSDRESLVKCMTREYTSRKSSPDLWARIEHFELALEIHPHHVNREIEIPDFSMCDLHASTMRLVVQKYTRDNDIEERTKV